jgi:D-alanyl-lipoteichoic acid acyltransferase DltB (MBOAT superfamily)
MMFRIIHLLVDGHGEELPRGIGLRDYVCYVCFFPTLLVGPIQRLQDFSIALRQAAPPPAQIYPIVHGYFKFTVVAGLFFAGFRSNAGAAAPIDAPRQAAALVCFAAYLYASFSGYSDVARAASAA